MKIFIALKSQVSARTFTNNFIIYANKRAPKYVTWFTQSPDGQKAVGRWNWSRLEDQIKQASEDFSRIAAVSVKLADFKTN